MNISILEIFTVFWIAALLWVAVEYFMYRFSRQHRDRTMTDQFRHE
ncbi:MAG: hypothetical protein KBA61_01375 [Spirochaetes bacterium]|nr:hypothetical protein [Spirochaetota bacterium]HPA73219.1 hypothetical protein [Spirochaetota bacterium]